LLTPHYAKILVATFPSLVFKLDSQSSPCPHILHSTACVEGFEQLSRRFPVQCDADELGGLFPFTAYMPDDLSPNPRPGSQLLSPVFPKPVTNIFFLRRASL
jgi:hypothetical protein